MLKRRALLAMGLLASVALGTGWLAAARAQSSCTVKRGAAAGDWTLPSGPGAFGSAHGFLYFKNTPVYDFSAVLEELASPCLSCREGTLDGVLDDGVGPGPDYVVRGEWLGSFFTGEGTWKATIFQPTPTGLVPVGRMRGRYDDPPNSPLPVLGTFQARWTICN